MTPEQLKASILQYAIQGKLVEQRPEEGTGEELYQRIQKEKKQLIKDGKIKKEKPLPEITEDEIPFDIPESWKWVRWGNLSQSIQYGYNTPAKSAGRIKMVRISDIQDGNIAWETVPFCDISETEIPTYLLATNDILFARTGGTVGKSYIVKNIPESAIYAGYLIRTRYSDALCPEYLYLFMQTPLYWNQLRNGTIATAQPNCNGQTLSKMILPLPPLAEQHRIVAKIEELLPYIDRYTAAYEKLEQFNAKFPEEMKKSILQYAIQGKLVEQRPEDGTGEELYQQIQKEKKQLIKDGKIKKEKPLPEITEDEIPFDIPESWKWVRVGQIVMLNPKNNLDDKMEVSFISMPCVMDGFRNQHTFEIKKWKDVKKGFTHFAENDIGVAKITPCFQNRKSVIFKNLINGYGAGSTELSIVRSINDTVIGEYLLWFFKTGFFITNGVKTFTGTAGQQRIHKDYLASCLLPLPPLAEQKRIVAKLEEILPLCERLKF